MKSPRLLTVALALAFAATACGSSTTSSTSDGPVTLDVWLMKDSVTADFLERFRTDFEAGNSNIKLNVQIQEWGGIGQKIVSALASNDAPDVIEVGNTQVAQYAASGGVVDLSDKVDELGGQDWIPGLSEPGAVDGKQYGIPYYAANRVVIYHKDLFAQAGIAAPPKTRAEWLDITSKLNQGANQGIYLPGQNWYVLSGFVWDEGGDLAVRDGDQGKGGKWKGGLGTPAGTAAVDFYKQLQALGKGPKDSDEAKPQQTDVFSRGDVAQLIAVPGAAGVITKANPALEGKLGFFPIPGKTASTPGAVFTGGSDLIVPVASDHQDQAYQLIKAIAGEKWQTELAKTMNYVPNRTSLASALSANPGAAAMAAGAVNGHGTPQSPNWAAVEAKNPIKEFLTAVLTGGDPAAEAAKADTVIANALNSGK